MQSIQRNISLHVPDKSVAQALHCLLSLAPIHRVIMAYHIAIHIAFPNCIDPCLLLRRWDIDMISKSRNRHIDRNYR